MAEDKKAAAKQKTEDRRKAEQRAAEAAEGQHGAISHHQMVDAGFTTRRVKAKLQRGQVEATSARMVYRMPGSPRTWKQNLWIALLAAPPRSVISHRSAAALHGLGPPPAEPDVTVPPGVSGRFKGARRFWDRLDSADTCDIDGFPTTTAARTILDCSAVLEQPELNDLVDSAIGRHRVTYRRIDAARRRSGRKNGAPRLRVALGPYGAGARPGSPAAARVLRRIYEWGLPMPVCEYKIRDAEGQHLGTVDFAWPEFLVGFEYDGDEFHGPRRWAADDARQDRIEEIGWRIERGDRDDLRPSSDRVRILLLALLTRPA
jgi:hypothetical protein